MPRTTTRPTIIDIAHAAGVSKSLVSLALRGEAGVGEGTRTRILHAADEMGYRSNVWARNLVRGSTGLVGVLITDIANTYHTDVAVGIEQAAEELGHDVLIAHGRRSSQRLGTQLERLLALGVEALAVVSSWVAPAELESAASRTPLVVVGRLPVAVPGVDTINNDDADGARAAVEHLVELGHDRIAHLSMSSRPAAMERRRSYAVVMRELGLDRFVRVVHAVHDKAGLPALLRGTERADGTGPSAVFASNDPGALTVMEGALDLGLSVPDGLSVVGYDNSSLATLVRPRLTSVDQPRALMGHLAMELLAERLGGRTVERHEVLAPSLIVRASTGPPG